MQGGRLGKKSTSNQSKKGTKVFYQKIQSLPPLWAQPGVLEKIWNLPDLF